MADGERCVDFDDCEGNKTRVRWDDSPRPTVWVSTIGKTGVGLQIPYSGNDAAHIGLHLLVASGLIDSRVLDDVRACILKGQ